MILTILVWVLQVDKDMGAGESSVRAVGLESEAIRVYMSGVADRIRSFCCSS